MKKQLLLFSFLLIAFSGFSQEKQKTIGLLLAPVGSYQPGFPFQFAYSGGVFYDHQFTRRSGLNTGVGLIYFRDVENDTYPEWCSNCEAQFEAGLLPKKIITRSTFLELPVNYTFTLNPESQAGFKALLFTGFTFSKHISWSSNNIYNNREEVVKLPMNNGSFLKYTYLNLGFELRKKLGEDYAFAFGTKLILVPGSLPFTLNLKFGRNL